MTRKLLVCSLLLAACSGGDDSSDDASISGDTADGGVDTDTGGEVTGDDVSDTAPELDAPDEGSAEDTTQVDVPATCDGTADCGEGFLCVDNLCASLTCANPADWVKCQDLFNRLGPDEGRYAVCENRQCRQACYFDTDCADGEMCTDFGYCRAVTGDFSITAPHGATTGPLQAGVANLLMNFPIGVPLGGYGQRAAFDDGRYARSLTASVGEWEGLYGRAVALDNGSRHLMIIRLPLIFTSMATHEVVAEALQERTGQEWRNSLIISSTHTHSGPARHWHLPPEAAAPLGAFGIGEFSQWFYELLNEFVIELAFAALDDLAPAKIGWDIVESFDTDDEVGRDRWGASPPFDDNRALLIRIDDLADRPRAVLFSFGMHGTDNDSDYATTDAPGAAEYALESALYARYEEFIPVLFVNENSGTMGPNPGAGGHASPMGLQHLGLRFVDDVWDALMAIEMTTELTLQSRTTRFPISYDLLGYDRGQFAANIRPPFGGEYYFGGLSCVGDDGGDDDYATHDRVETMSCAGALHFLLYNHPPTTLTRSQVMALEMNGLTIVTMPGELSQELSWQILRALRDTYAVDPMSAFTWGYANDHLFYLLPTNLRGEDPPFPGHSTPQPIDSYPDFAFSYLQGAYETTMSMWGPNQGDFLVLRAMDAYAALVDPEFVPPLPQPYPDQYSPRAEDPFPIDATPADRIGQIVQDVPGTVERFETIEFAWVGGDPGAEMPQTPLVTLEYPSEEAYFDAIAPNGRPYSNREPLMITRVRQAGDGEPWEWVVRWEELETFVAGTYRFRVDGHYLDADGTRQPYTLHSAQFELVPTDDILVSAEVTGGTISGTLGFPTDERLRVNGPSADEGAMTGNYRMRHRDVPTGLNPPVSAIGLSITLLANLDGMIEVPATVSATTASEDVGGRVVPVTRYELSGLELPPGDHEVIINVTDAFGNTGAFSGTLAF